MSKASIISDIVVWKRPNPKTAKTLIQKNKQTSKLFSGKNDEV